MNDFLDAQKTNPIQSQFKANQTRSGFIPKGAQIPTGELLGILKPGTNFKLFAADVIHELRCVAVRWRMDYNRYRPHHNIRGQCNVD